MNSDGGFDEVNNYEYKGIRTLRNLSVNQINSMENDSSSSIHFVDNSEVSNVLVCGYVSSLRSVPSGIIFEIEDTTGKLPCTYWLSNNAYDDLIRERINENNILKVSGSLKYLNQQKTLNVSSVVIVTANYLTYHFVSCVYQSLFNKHLIERKKPAQPTHSTVKPVTATGMSVIQTDTLKVFRNNQDENGLDLVVVINMLKSKYSEHDIREAVESLLNNCHLYSVDGDSYKSVA